MSYITEREYLGIKKILSDRSELLKAGKKVLKHFKYLAERAKGENEVYYYPDFLEQAITKAKRKIKIK